MWSPKRRLLKSSMMPNWHILATKLLIAQTANNSLMSLINSWEDIKHHLFLPQLLDCLPDQFPSYLHDKVAIIRNQLDCGTSHASPYNHDIEFHQTPFTSFQPITTDYLHSFITKCARKSYELDAISTSLLLECLDTVLPTMTSILMTPLSLASFHFLQICHCHTTLEETFF